MSHFCTYEDSSAIARKRPCPGVDSLEQATEKIMKHFTVQWAASSSSSGHLAAGLNPLLHAHKSTTAIGVYLCTINSSTVKRMAKPEENNLRSKKAQ
ncbi:hypothetical protein JTE90_020072 [Oedothorax gibbosus]|uniref:Uncharacterized protein n=1 Tax=Oedothorax gibbosus TaxID=931172 RepID=A0AAV6UTN6_9ARAC|nr:hypothetical protein JTE90_020072 [Oedothorax gibbosus]